jgi:hypothetical protein
MPALLLSPTTYAQESEDAEAQGTTGAASSEASGASAHPHALPSLHTGDKAHHDAQEKGGMFSLTTIAPQFLFQ